MISPPTIRESLWEPQALPIPLCLLFRATSRSFGDLNCLEAFAFNGRSDIPLSRARCEPFATKLTSPYLSSSRRSS